MAKFFNKIGLSRREVAPATSPAATPVQQEESKSGNWQEHVEHANGLRSSLVVSAWTRAVEVRATTMSQLFIEYQRYDAQGKNFVAYSRGSNGNNINYLLQVRPNPLMTAPDLMMQAEINIMMKGNAFIYIERDWVGDPVAFWLAVEGAYEPVANRYILTYNKPEGPRVVKADPSDVLHIPNTFRVPGGYVGIPTLIYAAKALNLAATSDREALSNAAKGGKLKLLVQENNSTGNFGLGRVSQKEMKKITDQLNTDVYSQDVVMLSNIAGVTPISMTAQQMDLLNSRQFNVEEIARFTGVPKSLLMDDRNSSYKTPEVATIEFLTRTIQPKISQWEAELNSKLLSIYDYGERRYHINERQLHRLDAKGQADIDKIHLETGIKSVNELRRQYDLPSIDKGDTHYVSTNLAEVGSAKLRGEAAQKGVKK